MINKVIESDKKKILYKINICIISYAHETD